MQNATLIIADDHPLFRAALREAVTQLLPGVRVVEASSLDTLQQAVASHVDADLILLDLHMPGAQGFSSLVYLRAQYPAIPVAVVSAAEEPAVIRRALDFGAAAYSRRFSRCNSRYGVTKCSSVFASPTQSGQFSASK